MKRISFTINEQLLNQVVIKQAKVNKIAGNSKQDGPSDWNHNNHNDVLK